MLQRLTRILYITEFASAVGEQTGPISGKPPPVSDETKAVLTEMAKSSVGGQHAPGKGAGSKVGTAETVNGEKKVKSEKDCTYSRQMSEELRDTAISIQECIH